MENVENPRKRQAKFYLSSEAIGLLHKMMTLSGTQMSAVVDRLVRREVPKMLVAYERPRPEPQPPQPRRKALPAVEL